MKYSQSDRLLIIPDFAIFHREKVSEHSKQKSNTNPVSQATLETQRNYARFSLT